MSSSDSFESLGRLADELADASDLGAPADEADEAAAVRRAAEALGAAVAFAPDEIAAVLDDVEEPAIPPPELPEDYEVLGEIGRGGMGVVYRARQRSLDRTVAVKVLRPGELLFGQALKRFQREARALAKLRHRHIVSIHEVGESDGQVWFSMDWIAGRSLAEIVRNRRVTPSRAVKLLRQVTSAIAYVHTHGLVHRDLKPANILVEEDGDAIVTDFGLALEIGSADGLTMTGQILGTPAYMSPEQARGDTAAIGEATDVYALGAVLYECLTGRRPFEGESPAMQVWSVLHREPTAPRRIDKRIPVDLEVICLKAMRKRPEDRYPTARALLEDLERFEAGRSIRAKPPSRAYRLGRFIRRHRAPMAWATGVLVAAVALFVFVIAPRLLNRPDRLLEAADELVAEKEPGGAMRLYERAIALSDEPPSRALYAKLTQARLDATRNAWAQGRAGDSVAWLEHALQEGNALFGEGRDPSSWEDAGRVAWSLATSLALEGRREEAKSRFDQARHHWDIGRRGGGLLDEMEPLLPALADAAHPLHEAVRVQVRALSASSMWIRGIASLLKRLPEHAVQEVIALAEEYALGSAELEHAPVVDREFVVAARRLARPGLEAALAEALAITTHPPAVRQLLGTLLADHADLPVRLAFSLVPDEDLDYHVSNLLEAWRGTRGLQPDDAMSWRVARAFETWTQIEEDLQDEWDGQSLRARENLQRWLAHRTGHRGEPFRADMQAWYREHAGEKPFTWLEAALDMGPIPGGDEGRKLLVRRMFETEGDERAWLHFLLARHVPRRNQFRVPVWGTQWVGRDVVPRWRARLYMTPDYTHARLATFVLDENGWRIAGHDRRRIGRDLVVDLHYDAPIAPEPYLAASMTIPGLPAQAAGEAVQTLDIKGELTWTDLGLEYRVMRTMRRRGPSWSSSSGGSGSMHASWVMSPTLRIGGWSHPDPFRKQLTLMMLETPEASGLPLTLEEWNARRIEDLTDLASKAEAYDIETPHGPGANQYLYAHQQSLSNVLGSATWIPLKGGIQELRRLETVMREETRLDHQPRLALLARLMAGDERALDEFDFDARLAKMRPDGIAFMTAGRDGEYWIRLLRLSLHARIRNLALVKLQTSEISARAAGDLLDLWRAGGVELPDDLVARLRDGPTEDRTWWGLIRHHAGWSIFAGVILLVGLLLSVRVLWPGLRVDQRLSPAAWLIVVGLLTACVTIFLAGVDLLPAALGYGWAALGAWVLGREADDRFHAQRVMLFGVAAAFSIRTVLGAAGDVEVNLAGVAAFVAFASLPALVRALRGEPARRRPWPWAFFLFYVLPLGLMYVAFAVLLALGKPVHVELGGLLGTIVLIAVPLCVLWALLSLLGAAGVRKAWLRSRRVKTA